MHLLDSGLQTRTYGTAALLDSKSGCKLEFMMKMVMVFLEVISMTMVTRTIVMVMVMMVVNDSDVVTSRLPRAAAVFGRRRL